MYGMRNKTSEKITLSCPQPDGRSFGSGDVDGLYISIPPLRPPSKRNPHNPANIKCKRIAIEFKGQEYFESLKYSKSKQMLSLTNLSCSPQTALLFLTCKKSATVKNVPERGMHRTSSTSGAGANPNSQTHSLPTLPDSKVVFFVNGQSQGIAFCELYNLHPLHMPANVRKVQAKCCTTCEGAHEHKKNHFDHGSLSYFPFIFSSMAPASASTWVQTLLLCLPPSAQHKCHTHRQRTVFAQCQCL